MKISFRKAVKSPMGQISGSVDFTDDKTERFIQPLNVALWAEKPLAPGF